MLSCGSQIRFCAQKPHRVALCRIFTAAVSAVEFLDQALVITSGIDNGKAFAIPLQEFHAETPFIREHELRLPQSTFLIENDHFLMVQFI